ncbi:phosphoglycerate mutase [Aspergillus cavernicola]|uniref:Phosphoglycerate mutase n=1 Tax=Aspergillus cavernicola TaxID=176166 RepID=A0ABR4IHI2_9EURO
MTSKVHLVRHAESVHNVSQDFSQFDPDLTPLGLQQAMRLSQSFPYTPKVGAIITSPLKRAVQTTLAAFPHILDKRYFDPKSGHGIESGATLILDPDLQERSALPCDTGSTSETLEMAFPRLGIKDLAEGWQVKEGLYSPADEAVEERAKRGRSRIAAVSEDLKHQERTHVVVVTHGVFMKFLVEDPEIDLPKAGWKSYTVGTRSSDIVLLPL